LVGDEVVQIALSEQALVPLPAAPDLDVAQFACGDMVVERLHGDPQLLGGFLPGEQVGHGTRPRARDAGVFEGA
jgi:hypothetical protein